MTELYPERDFSHSPPDPKGRSYRKVNPCNLDWSQGRYLIEHLEATAEEITKLAKKIDAMPMAHRIALWHDIGKYRPAFQAYLRGQTTPDKSHQFAGAALAARLKTNQGNIIAWLIAGHHGGLANYAELAPYIEKQGEKELVEALATQRVPDHLLQTPALSPNSIFDQIRPYVEQELTARFLFSMLVDVDHADAANHFDKRRKPALEELQEKYATPFELQQKLTQHLQQFENYEKSTVNQYRDKVLDYCRQAAKQSPGCFTLTVPTGGGKTLSSMAFALDHAVAHGYERVIVVLPFTSIIEQSAKTYCEIFGDENVLEHHGNWEAGNGAGAKQVAYQHQLQCENWDVPIVVTTAVQFLESLHSNHPNRVRKLHNVLKSVVVMDEVQTLPVPLLHITLDTLAGLVKAFPVSLLLCTATQPTLSERAIFKDQAILADEDYHHLLPEGVPVIPKSFEKEMFKAMQRVRVHWPKSHVGTNDWAALPDRLRALKQVLVIVDQRAHAFELAQTMAPEWLHLSGNMLPHHRLNVIRLIKERLEAGDDCCVVSTQIVEAGVDIDFPAVFRALAGCEALAQSAGRCNRNGKLLRLGDFYIFRGKQPPYADILRRGYEFVETELKKGPLDLNDPSLFPRYFRDLYSKSDKDRASMMKLRESFSLKDLARCYRIIDDHQVPVLIPLATDQAAEFCCLDGDVTAEKKRREQVAAVLARAKKGYPTQADIRLLDKNTISIPEKHAKRLKQAGALFELHPKVPLLCLDPNATTARYDDRLGFDYFPSDKS